MRGASGDQWKDRPVNISTHEIKALCASLPLPYSIGRQLAQSLEVLFDSLGIPFDDGETIETEVNEAIAGNDGARFSCQKLLPVAAMLVQTACDAIDVNSARSSDEDVKAEDGWTDVVWSSIRYRMPSDDLQAGMNQ